MASLKEVKSRINSVRNTRKITSAMKMVASAKLHKAQGAIERVLPYENKLNEILINFLGTGTTIHTPYTEEREVKRVAIVVFSSNSSLCGAFNSNVIKKLLQVLYPYKDLDRENILVYPVGKKVEEAVCKMGYDPQGSYQNMSAKPSYEEAAALARRLMEEFVNKRVDRVELIYHHFRSMGTQVLTTETFLPIDLSEIREKAAGQRVKTDYIVEPSVEELIVKLLPQVLMFKMYSVLLDSTASEHAARTLAMQIATDNASDLIDELTLLYNKTRQQAITSELLDILGGSMQ
ncbi:MAG: F0F1 ATP synthase subunit gamma [Bacteroides sp.]|nr:F0F1 ATP synthase subunit gamma [Bacteroides sp.]